MELENLRLADTHWCTDFAIVAIAVHASLSWSRLCCVKNRSCCILGKPSTAEGTDVYSMPCCHMYKVTGIQNFTQVSLAQCWKTFRRLPISTACICKCL